MSLDRLALELKFAASGDDMTFAGVASTFGGVDRHGDTIRPGAYARTLAEHKAAGTMPALLWSHDPSEPIGVITALSEERDGLKIAGRLADTARGRDARELAKMGAMTGLSIGFRTRKASTGPNGTRVLEDIDLAEISFVASPADPGARLTAIKSAEAQKGSDAMSTNSTGAAPDLAAIETKIAGLTDEVKALKTANEALETALARPAIVTKADDKTPEQKAFIGFARKGIERLGADEVKVLRVSNDAAGGYLAPEQFIAELLRGLTEISPIRQVARVMTIGASEVKMPKRTTALSATWTGETADRTGSEPEYDQVTLTPHELATFVDVSNALLEDAMFPIESELATDFVEAFGKAEGKAFVDGNGTGRPEGIWTNADVPQVAGGHASNLTYAGLNSLFHSLPSFYAARGTWLMTRGTMGLCRGIVDGQNRPIWIDNMAAGNPPTLFGRPVLEVVDAPAVAANAFPIVFGDINSAYRITDRVALSVLRDPYSVATKGQTRFHARRRVGGAVVKAEAIRKLKVATTIA